MRVEVPRPEQDKPELGRVGVIAVAGFVIGVAWPWLAGVRLVPSPPTEETALEAVTSAAVPASSSAPPSVDPSALGAQPGPPQKTDAETTKISELQLTACRDGKGKRKKDCDKLAVDDRVRPHLAALVSCAEAQGASETLSIGLDLSFTDQTIGDVFAGKSTTFPKEKARALVDCAKKELASVKLDGVGHEHDEYTVFYFVEFVPPGSALANAAGTGDETSDASGLVTVMWDSAVVRDQPEDGKIVSRLRYGTRVAVSAKRGKWYEVRYDAKGDKGWVHRNALGM
ncbi:MAG TPA: SH3 domain-containing protein [Polyangiaceae bacterium]|nr:SH3 domain-containing protein [Polyangiaceae bacterium]